MNKMKIGIFGGTFDPFHCGHYEIVNTVLKSKLVDKVIILPTIVSYYRKDKLSLFTNKERLRIISKWFENRQDVIIDDSEYHLKDNGSRRYIDMLEDQIRENPGAEIYTIIGGDSLVNFKTWYRWEDILKKTKLIVIGRGDVINSDIPHEMIDIPRKFSDISATDIRRRVLDGTQFTFAEPIDLYMDEIEQYLKDGMTYFERIEHEKKILDEVCKKMLTNIKK